MSARVSCGFWGFGLVLVLVLQASSAWGFVPSAFAEIPANGTRPVGIVDEWRNLEFLFDSPEQRDYAVAMGFYSPANQTRPCDVDYYVAEDDSRIRFVTVPRIGQNVPFTLATVDDGERTADGPLLRAYPDMEMHLNRSCEGLFSAHRIWVDPDCARLWVIDSGHDLLAGNRTQVCPPKIVVFDLRTGALEFKYEIPSEQYVLEQSVFTSITLQPQRCCEKSIAFVTDPRGAALLVFSLCSFSSWLTRSQSYQPDPDYNATTIAGESFASLDGVYTVAPNVVTNELFFHAFAAVEEVTVPLSVVLSESKWSSNQTLDRPYFQTIGRRPTQSPTEVVDSRGNLWFTLLDPLAVVCWSPWNPYSEDFFKVVAEDAEKLQFVSGLKIRRDPSLGEILVGLSNRLQKHVTGTVDPEEINYRIFYMPIADVACCDLGSEANNLVT